MICTITIIKLNVRSLKKCDTRKLGNRAESWGNGFKIWDRKKKIEIEASLCQIKRQHINIPWASVRAKKFRFTQNIFLKINSHQPDHSPILWLGDLSHAEEHQGQGGQGPIVSHAWPLIGQHWPRDLSTGLWLADTDHVTWDTCLAVCDWVRVSLLSHLLYIATWSLSG